MISEKVTVKQAVKRLSEANNNKNTPLPDLENRLDDLSCKITSLQNAMTNQWTRFELKYENDRVYYRK